MTIQGTEITEKTLFDKVSAIFQKKMFNNYFKLSDIKHTDNKYILTIEMIDGDVFEISVKKTATRQLSIF